MEKTIKRNTKKDRDIFDNAINIKSYTLENCFTGKPCKRIGWDGKNWLEKEWRKFDFSKLTTDGKGAYCLHIHSNCWYEFDSVIDRKREGE